MPDPAPLPVSTKGYTRPITFVFLLPNIIREARAVGYAIALHGSMCADYDLIAVPWTEDAKDASTLVSAVIGACGALYLDDHENAMHGNPTEKAHGRLAWRLMLGGSFTIDLSVMPRVPADKA